MVSRVCCPIVSPLECKRVIQRTGKIETLLQALLSLVNIAQGPKSRGTVYIAKHTIISPRVGRIEPIALEVGFVEEYTILEMLRSLGGLA